MSNAATNHEIKKSEGRLTKQLFYENTDNAIPIVEETITSYIIPKPLGVDCEFMAVPKTVTVQEDSCSFGVKIRWLFHHNGMSSSELEDELNIRTEGQPVKFFVGRIIELPVIKRLVEYDFSHDCQHVYWADSRDTRKVFVPDRNGNILIGSKRIDTKKRHFDYQGYEIDDTHMQRYYSQDIEDLDIAAQFTCQLETCQRNVRIRHRDNEIHFQMCINECNIGFRPGLDDLISGYRSSNIAAVEYVLQLRELIGRLWDSYWQVDPPSTLPLASNEAILIPPSAKEYEITYLSKITEPSETQYSVPNTFNLNNLPKDAQPTLSVQLQRSYDVALSSAKQKAIEKNNELRKPTEQNETKDLESTEYVQPKEYLPVEDAGVTSQKELVREQSTVSLDDDIATKLPNIGRFGSLLNRLFHRS